MSLIPISLTTVGGQLEVLATPPERTQYEIKVLTTFKDSTYTFNLSIETGRGVRTIFSETVTDGGSIIFDNTIVVNYGDRLVSQSSTPGIDINITVQNNSFV